MKPYGSKVQSLSRKADLIAKKHAKKAARVVTPEMREAFRESLWTMPMDELLKLARGEKSWQSQT